MKLIVLTPEETLSNETDLVNSMLENGLQRLHVRKPLFTAQDYKNYIGTIHADYHSSIVIHGSFELYDVLNLGGVHLNNEARNDNAIREGIRHIPAASVSTSFHSWQEIEKNKFQYGYVFISPVFNSISKKGYKAGIDLEGAEEAKGVLAIQGKYCPEIIGLGGVDAKHIKKLYQHGFDGAAILGAIWEADEPLEKFESILAAASKL